ncbi:MAG: hypothetical protein HY365_03450 [Candidatus Aenigmarchaeota archaeon]|nr:hypothetical protein [Candidatus Aenigmarchaeota archaeon]
MVRLKGFIYTLEVLIAISLIAVSSSLLFSRVPEKPDFAPALLKERAFEALDSLYNGGSLASYVANNSEPGLEQSLLSLLPSNYLFETEICSETCDTLNVPGNRSVVSADYYVGSYRGSYVGKRVKIWSWTE